MEERITYARGNNRLFPKRCMSCGFGPIYSCMFLVMDVSGDGLREMLLLSGIIKPDTYERNVKSQTY